ncbi:MAG: hypothetical protein M3Z83_10885, partial [Actinomycetota bacterium]|nr:hypothetical protein [Actinomycetota bacterium]
DEPAAPGLPLAPPEVLEPAEQAARAKQRAAVAARARGQDREVLTVVLRPVGGGPQSTGCALV